MKLIGISALLATLVATSAHATLIDRTVTVDFESKMPDAKMKWKGVDFETGQIVVEPKFDAPGWQLRLKQGYVGTNRGWVAEIKTSKFATVKVAPTDTKLFSGDEVTKPGGPGAEDLYNKKLLGWGQYHLWDWDLKSFVHLFSAQPVVYIIRTVDGRYAKVQFLDYIKDGLHEEWYQDGLDRKGEPKMKQRVARVSKDDGMVHITFRVKINSKAGDKTLE